MNINTVFSTLVRLVLLLVVLPFHECAHAVVADWLGDDTVRLMGRKSLNPFVHLDLMGSLLILFSGFGWAKPVPVAAYRFKNRKSDMAATALAGPLSNVILAYILAILYKTSAFFMDYRAISPYALPFVYAVIYSTLALAVFNMIPIPPLDGSRILTALLPDGIYDAVMKYERIIMVALMLGLYFNVLKLPIGAATDFLYEMVDKTTSFMGLLPVIY